MFFCGYGFLQIVLKKLAVKVCIAEKMMAFYLFRILFPPDNLLSGLPERQAK